MDILQTHKIPSAIIDIIDKCEEYCYIVSPYINLWPLLERSLSKAAKQKKRITFIVRNDPKVNHHARKIHQDYGFEVISLNNLHAKLYLSEKQALVTSMNLYDSSKERNHEIGILSNRKSFCDSLLQEYILNDLLQVKPFNHYTGYFENEDRQLASDMIKIEAQLENLGFCVVCGNSIDVEMSARSTNGHFRCIKCFRDSGYPNPYEFKTRFCHLCGKSFDSYLDNPFHKKCREKLESYVNWIKLGKRGNNPQPR